MNSALFRLNSSDWVKGLIVAVLTPIVLTLAEALPLPGFDFAALDWKGLAMLGVSAGLAYVLKNFLSDGKGNPLGMKLPE